MEFIHYYKLLKPENNTRVLVCGENAIALALFLSGKAKEEGKTIESTALLPEETEVQSINEEIYSLKQEYPKIKETLEKGLSRTNFEKTGLVEFNSKLKFDYLVFYTEELKKEHLKAIIKLKLKKIILNLPISYSMPIENQKKTLFIKKKQVNSLRQLLKKHGAQVEFYDSDDKRLIVLFSNLKKAFELKQAYIDDIANDIIKDYHKYLKFIKEGSVFALKSRDEEYLYYIRVYEKRNSPYKYNFIFLNGTTEKEIGEIKTRSKEYEIIILPNTPVFKKELDKKEVIITTKERAVQIFQETYSPI